MVVNPSGDSWIYLLKDMYIPLSLLVDLSSLINSIWWNSVDCSSVLHTGDTVNWWWIPFAYHLLAPKLWGTFCHFASSRNSTECIKLQVVFIKYSKQRRFLRGKFTSEKANKEGSNLTTLLVPLFHNPVSQGDGCTTANLHGPWERGFFLHQPPSCVLFPSFTMPHRNPVITA